MYFDHEVGLFLQKHIQSSHGQRRRRLEEGLGHSEMLFLEKIWWPLFQHFKHLHPEYEVHDFKDGKRYLDFAYLYPSFKICFEIDGYGPHAKDISRWQFSDQLMRQNHLVIDGWHIICFSTDQIHQQPRACQQTTQSVIGRLLGQELNDMPLSIYEKEVLRLALGKGGPITNKDVRTQLNLTDKPVKKILTQLVQKGILAPTSGTHRIHAYHVTDQFRNPFLKKY